MSDEDFTRFDQETAGIADPQPEPTPGEVIPPGQDGAADTGIPLDIFITEELVGAFFSLPANMMARKTGHEWWRIEEEESELLGKACTPGVKYLVEKYLSAVAGPLTALGAGLGVIYGPRIVHENLVRRAEKEEQQPTRRHSTGDSRASSENVEPANPQSNSEWHGVMNES